MIKIGKLEIEDLMELEELHRDVSEFPIPNLSNPNNIIQKGIKFNGQFIGSCFVWRTTEVSLIIDPKISKIVRAKVIMQLFDTLLKELTQLGYQDTHVFVLPEEDTKYAGLLKRKFNFVDAKGIPLYWRE